MGFEFKGNIKDLSVSCHLAPTQKTHDRKFSRIQHKITKYVTEKSHNQQDTPTHLEEILDEREIRWLKKYYPPTSKPPKLSFGINVPINRQRVVKMLIINHSATPTKVSMNQLSHYLPVSFCVTCSVQGSCGKTYNPQQKKFTKTCRIIEEARSAHSRSSRKNW